MAEMSESMAWYRTGSGLACSILLLISGLVSACRFDTYDNIQELDTVFTARRPSQDFQAFKKYALLDDVFDLSGLVEDAVEVDHSFDAVILNAIERNVGARGFERIADPNAPEIDLTFAAGVVAQNNWVLAGYYPWYGYPGWYWYYPPVVVPVSYPVGTVVVAAFRPVDAKVDDSGRTVVPLLWASAMAGVLSTNASDTTARINSSIDQAFAQSPYLQSGVEPAKLSMGSTGVVPSAVGGVL